MFDVNFEEEFKILTHPSQAHLAKRLREELAAVDFTKHFAIFSSGTTSREMKGYILSEKALEANAQAVNSWFGLTSQDVWGLSLPVYHVGGLSVLIRARLLGNKIIDLRGWNPKSWFDTITREKVTISTIVPTQLYDLVSNNLNSPPGLRSLIVGGDFLPSALEKKARDLGWPVIRTYGMSEVGSQLASGKLPGDPLRILPLHTVRLSKTNFIQVRTSSLFDAEFRLGEKFSLRFAEDFLDADGFYTTQDRGELVGDTLTPLGRAGQEIKVAGHLTSLLALKDSVSSVLLQHDSFGKAEIITENDERKGQRLVLLHQGLPEKILNEISKSIAPAVLDEERAVEAFGRTELGKLRS